MDRSMKYGGHCADEASSAEVPIGWQRKIHQSGVVYISPSGSVLACLEQAKSYLLTDGTCKCGLECPLILHKVFNFDPWAAVKQRTAEDVKADADVTKLCIHKRKLIAVATLHRSMESQLPSGATGAVHKGSLIHQAIRNDMHNGPSNSVALDSKNPYKMPVSGQQRYQHELSSPPQRDPYLAHNRPRLGGSDHSAQRSPYRSRHSVLLSPPPPASCSSQHYGDGTPSPRRESLRSPDPSAIGFHGALSPGSCHMNGERFTLLSPPSIVVHCSTSGTQPSCAMAGRTNVPLSPSVNVKSPNVQKSPCNYSQSVDYQHKPPSVRYTLQPPPVSQLPPCVVQKKQVTSEKDPLGILDPIPSKSHIQDQALSNPATLQFNSTQPQVPSMNVNIPPAIVPLPSNLPLPMVKSGPAGHGHRVQHPTTSSVSSSPITSPLHMAGPALNRVEETPHHLLSSISPEHGSYALSTGFQVSKLPSRSPRASVGSPRPSVPLHHLKDAPNQLLGGMSSGLSRHPNSICPPAPGSDHVCQSNPSLGVPSHQPLDQQDPSSFPASSLLSAAAKAQLVNQNKVTDAPAGAEAWASSLGHPGLVGGGRPRSLDGYGISDPKFLQNRGPPVSEGQSGRAALRDKLMAQQRGVLRKRKQSSEAGSDMSFNAHILHGSASSSSGYPEPLKRLLQQGVLPPNTSMAQLLQSMSHQSAQNGLSHSGHHAGTSGKSSFFEESVPRMSNSQSVQGPHQLHGRAEIPSCQNISSEGSRNAGEIVNMDQFAGPINQMHNPAFGGNFGTLGYGGHEAMGSMGNPDPHPQQFGHYRKPSQGNLPFRDRTGLPPVMSNGGFDTYSESGETRSLNSDLRQAQEGSLMSFGGTSQRRQQHLGRGELPLPAGHSLQSQDSLQGPGSHPGAVSSNSMDNLLQNFQAGLPERVLQPHRTAISRPGVMSRPGVPFSQDGQREYQADANHQAEVRMTREVVSSVITSNSSAAAYATSAVGAPFKLSNPVNSVIHGPLRSYTEEPVRRQSRVGRPRKKPEQTSDVSSGVMGAPVRFRPPRRGTQRRQWLRDVEGQEYGLWHNDNFLQQYAQDLNGNSYYIEMLKRRACPARLEYGPSHFNGVYSKNGLFTHMNGGGPTLESGLPSTIHSSRHSTGSEGGVAGFAGDYSHYNGHLNGQLSGNVNGHYKGNLNGHFTPNMSDGKISEENLRSANLLYSSQRLQYRPSTQNARELLWGQGLALPSWPSKLKEEGQMYFPGVGHSIQGKVEPEKFHKSLKGDLEALYKANRIHQSGGEINNHIEAAIEDAMSELNKLTGSMSQRDGQVKAPKPKRRKMSR